MTTIESIVAQYGPDNYGVERIRMNCENPEHQAFLFGVFELQTDSHRKEELIDLLAFRPPCLDSEDVGRAVLNFLSSDEVCATLITRAIRAGVDVNQTFVGISTTYTPLSYAAHRGAIDIAIELISLGADVEATTLGKESLTPLEAAACKGDREMVRLLLENGANPNRGSPISYAILGADPNVVHLLTTYGSDTERILARLVAQTKYPDTFIAFLDNTSYSPTAAADEDNCLFYHAAARHATTPTADTLAMVKALLDHGALPEQAREHAHRLPL